MRTSEQIKTEIESIERKIFYEEMADFMNWDYVRELEKKLKELRKELEEVEA